MPTMDSQRSGAAFSRKAGSANAMQRVLILGGTAEARELAQKLAGRDDFAVTLSLAGRTAAPAPQGVPVRVGGFGGSKGLAKYLAAERINVLIDATHPYAATMSDSAARAVQLIDVRLLALRRPAWVAVEGDRWTEVADAQHAVSALGQEPRHVFLTLGRQELGPFRQAPQHHYLIRSVDPVSPPLAVPHATYMTARGPFTEADDLALLKEHGIDVIVSKNSGGPATYSKIAAARTLGIEVVMITRPQLPEMPSVDTVDAVMEWLDHTDAS
jgi:precorrin-6A/cobalt-precorrin-6A reductase